MTRDLAKLSERRILQAQAEGKFDGLSGAGKPLPKHPEEALIDSGTAVGHRIMAEAGALPQEITIKRQVEAAREAYLAAKGGQDEKSAMARLAELEMKLSIAQEARRAFMR